MTVRSISKTTAKQNLGFCHVDEIFLLREFLKDVRIVLIQYASSLIKQLGNGKWLSMGLRLAKNFEHYSVRTSSCRNIKPK